MTFEYFDISLPKGKHLTHICERWAEDRTDGLQYAFFNGAGYESWENIWGIFNQITPRYKEYQFENYFSLKDFSYRDAAAIKRTSTILRQYGDFLQGGSQWIPHIPIIKDLQSKTFASEFRNEQKIIWLLVNRDKNNDESVELTVNCIQNSSNQGIR